MQCKDIPDTPILAFLAKQQRPANWYAREYENSVLNAMPAAANGKLGLAKMRILMRRGLVDGCACGCRGDFIITAKGRQKIAQQEGVNA